MACLSPDIKKSGTSNLIRFPNFDRLFSIIKRFAVPSKNIRRQYLPKLDIKEIKNSFWVAIVRGIHSKFMNIPCTVRHYLSKKVLTKRSMKNINLGALLYLNIET